MRCHPLNGCASVSYTNGTRLGCLSGGQSHRANGERCDRRSGPQPIHNEHRTDWLAGQALSSRPRQRSSALSPCARRRREPLGEPDAGSGGIPSVANGTSNLLNRSVLSPKLYSTRPMLRSLRGGTPGAVKVYEPRRPFDSATQFSFRQWLEPCPRPRAMEY